MKNPSMGYVGKLVTLFVAIFIIAFFGSSSQMIHAASPGFITTWTTTTPSEQITIPINPIYNTYNYDVDWGDGNTDTGDTGSATHTYTTAGTYTVTITGIFPAIYFHAASYAPLVTSVEQWGTNHWLSMNSAFYGCSNLLVTASDRPDLSGVTDMSDMFDFASSFNSDISSWDVSHVTNMSYMFRETLAFNQPLNSWDVSNVTNMTAMFKDADAFNQPLNLWNVSKVTTMDTMFKNTTIFDQDLSSWDVSHVTDLILFFQAGTGGFTPGNYSALLKAWAREPLQTGVAFFVGRSKYCPSAAAARASIISTYSWGILDGGLSTCPHTLTYTASSGGTLTGSTSQMVNEDYDGTAVNAVPNSGYHFVNWTGTETSTNNPLTNIDVTRDVTETANFALNPPTRSGGGLIHYGCKDPHASNYEIFAASNPSLCTYNTITTTTSTSSLQVQPLGISATTSISLTIPTRDLKKGMSGKDVMLLQNYLVAQDTGPAAKVFAQHGANNYFGKFTQAALIEFQKAYGILPATGYYGPKTRKYIKDHVDK